MERDFCRGWSFAKQGEGAVCVELPHDAMLYEKRSPDCANGERSGFFPGGRYVYEKEFYLTEAELEGYAALHFGGVYRHARVYVNGREVAEKAYGYNEFDAPLNGAAVAGRNIVRVTVDNSLEPNSRWYSGSGIYRPVTLVTEPAGYIRSIKVTTISYSPAIIKVECSDSNALAEVLDGERVVASGRIGEIPIESARLWSAEHPYLYRLRLSNAAGIKEISFGIRMLCWSAEKGLCVNGERVLLRGGCIHHDHGVLGACSFSDAEERRVRILKESGYNAIRSAHNPCSATLLDACDRLGMYVMDEAFDGWYIPKTRHDYSRDFWQNYKADLTAMAERDYNHPSVVIYSIGNEITEIGEQKGINIGEEMVGLLHAADSTRPVTCCINLMLALWASMGVGLYKDNGEYLPEPSDIDKKGELPLSGSDRFNALVMKFGRALNIQVATRRADRVLSGIAEKLDIVGLNYCRYRYRREVKQNPGRIIVGSETYIDDLPFNWEYVKSHPAFIGDFCWAAIDYIGETGVGYWSYPSYRGLPILTGSGAIDLIGRENAENGFQRVVWGLLKQPYIGVQPVSHNNERPVKKAWRFTNAIPSWNWQGCDGCRAVVEVFSRDYRVELLLCGKRLGYKRLKNCRARFNTRYFSGVLTAVAYDKNGNETGRSELASGESPKLHLAADKTVLRANGQDLCFVTIEWSDSAGVVCPKSGIKVEASVGGAARLQGLGSAAYTTDGSYTSGISQTFEGRCLAVVRAGHEAGSAYITVTAGGFTETLSIEVAD